MTELQASELQATAPLDDELAPVPENAGADDTKHKKAVRVWQGVLVLILLGFVLLLAARLIQTNQSEQRASGVAPAFTLTTFDGQKISSADLLGKGVVLNFWASWCDPCRDEAAMLEETWNREKDNGIVFVGLDYLDQEPAAKAYMAEFGITYPSGPDLQSAAARRFGIKGVPETFFINPQGSITDIVIGPIVSQGKMDEYLAKIRPQ
jgi:cytochrome c biogenesis protein CcmG/thiol:disulfide interchange protein DsbE